MSSRFDTSKVVGVSHDWGNGLSVLENMTPGLVEEVRGRDDEKKDVETGNGL